MALGTLTRVTNHGYSPTDIISIEHVSFAGDASYATGGYADFTETMQAFAERGLTVVAVFGWGDGGGAAYHLEYDPANDKLKVRAGATGLEVANATDLSGVTFKATVISK